MHHTTFQAVKYWVITTFSISKDAAHMHLGLVLFFILMFFCKKHRERIWLPAPVFVLAVLLEVPDIVSNYRIYGYGRWAASFHDVVNTMLWPVMLFFLYRRSCRTKTD